MKLEKLVTAPWLKGRPELETVSKQQADGRLKMLLKMICNDFLVVKVNCWSFVFNIIQSILMLRNIKDKKTAEKKRLKVRTDDLFTFHK